MYDITIRTEGQELHAYGLCTIFLVLIDLLFDFVVGLWRALPSGCNACQGQGFLPHFYAGVHADGRVVLKGYSVSNAFTISLPVDKGCYRNSFGQLVGVVWWKENF